MIDIYADSDLLFTLTHEDTALPHRGSTHAAGWDLTADETVTIPVGGTRMVSTGVSVAIPVGMFGLLVPRSSLGVRHRLGLANTVGVIDADYRGEIKAALVNNGSKPVTIERGTRVVQLIIQQFKSVTWVQVGGLPPTVRGEGGFGSTGS